MPDAPIKGQIDDFVDILRSRVRHRPLSEVAESLRAKMFDLRVAAIRWFAQEEIPLGKLLSTMEVIIAEKTREPRLTNVSDALQTTLRQYREIMGNYLDSVDFQNFEHTIAKGAEMPGYEAFTIFELHPGNRVKFIKKWLDQSLDFEAGMCMAELFILGDLELPTEKVNAELVPFLKQAITRFGAYAIFTGIWVPENPDENQLTTNMKILASTLELDHGHRNKRVAPEFFHELLQN